MRRFIWGPFIVLLVSFTDVPAFDSWIFFRLFSIRFYYSVIVSVFYVAFSLLLSASSFSTTRATFTYVAIFAYSLQFSLWCHSYFSPLCLFLSLKIFSVNHFQMIYPSWCSSTDTERINENTENNAIFMFKCYFLLVFLRYIIFRVVNDMIVSTMANGKLENDHF